MSSRVLTWDEGTASREGKIVLGWVHFAENNPRKRHGG
jgi:hypothetical protein